MALPLGGLPMGGGFDFGAGAALGAMNMPMPSLNAGTALPLGMSMPAPTPAPIITGVPGTSTLPGTMPGVAASLLPSVGLPQLGGLQLPTPNADIPAPQLGLGVGVPSFPLAGFAAPAGAAGAPLTSAPPGTAGGLDMSTMGLGMNMNVGGMGSMLPQGNMPTVTPMNPLPTAAPVGDILPTSAPAVPVGDAPAAGVPAPAPDGLSMDAMLKMSPAELQRSIDELQQKLLDDMAGGGGAAPAAAVLPAAAPAPAEGVAGRQELLRALQSKLKDKESQRQALYSNIAPEAVPYFEKLQAAFDQTSTVPRGGAGRGGKRKLAQVN